MCRDDHQPQIDSCRRQPGSLLRRLVELTENDMRQARGGALGQRREQAAAEPELSPVGE